MTNWEKISPMIVVGMHRSGTSMLTRVLSEMGVFVGADCRNNAESAFFQTTNIRILRAAGASWFRPAPMVDQLADQRRCEKLIAWLRRRCRSRKIRTYLGDQRNANRLDDLPVPWGWKDPRNTLTLPLWLQLFPNAKIIHVVRNGIDVAWSLMDRERRPQAGQNGQSQNFWLSQQLRKASWRLREVEGEEKTPFKDLQQAFSLWSDYLTIGERTLRTVEPSQVLLIRYEDFLNTPSEQLLHLTQFLGRETTEQKLTELATAIDPGRRLAFLDNPELVAFYETCKSHPMMQQFGYDSLTLGNH